MMPTQTPRTWLGAIGTLVVLVVFTVSRGLGGLALGGLVALSWWTLPSMYAFAIGQFGLVLLAADSSGLVAVVGGEFGLVAVLLQSTVRSPRPGRVLALSVSAVSAATILSWASYQQLDSIAGVGGFVLGGGTLAAYWAHRYERVALTETPTNE